MLRAGQAYRTYHQPMMEEEKGIILGFMEQNPKVTAKEIAKEMGVNLSLVHRRIRGLKKEGKSDTVRQMGGGSGRYCKSEKCAFAHDKSMLSITDRILSETFSCK
ncbi:MAG: winged helix-turn-helix domain-containing protein [Lachnospiraceae bacterium]|nr:winged helix-turn-helix domain-containing protein [Lachnospiraceae bacterium]